MSGPAPTTSSIILSALRKLGIMGAAQSAPNAEDTELALAEFNEIAEMWNLRKRKAFFQRSQEFTFGASHQSYSIGTAANGADFVVAAGGRPVRLELAQLVLTGSTPNLFIPVANIGVEQYNLISQPALSSDYPSVLYYKPTWPNGTILPYPAFPTQTSYKLNLTWWNQFETVDIADIATELILPFGYVRAFALTLAEALWLAFPKRTDLDELKRQARIARAEMEAPNVTPPTVDSTDGVNSNDSGDNFDWRSRQWS